MRFNLKNEIQKKIYIYSTSLIIAILAFLFISKLDVVARFISNVLNILLPFILGFGIAFLLNGPITWFENRLAQKTRLKKGSRRLVSTAVMFLLAILFVLFSLWVIIPSLIDSVKIFIENFSTYASTAEEWLTNIAERFNLDISQVQAFYKSLNLETTVSTFLSTSITSAMSYSYDVVHTLTNLVISIAAGFYMMLDKENLLHGLKTILYSLISKKRANFLTLYSMDAKNVFQQYIVGNILDSFIIGIVCWMAMLLLQIPYAPMIGFIIGVTNIIPVFGPFLGAIPVIILLLMIQPMSAVVFAIFILILQQIDGNVLKPIILGDKLGISGFWILFSVTVGGSMFGIIGMFLGVPIFALIYEGIKDLIDMRLHQKHITVPEESGVIE